MVLGKHFVEGDELFPISCYEFLSLQKTEPTTHWTYDIGRRKYIPKEYTNIHLYIYSFRKYIRKELL